MTLSKLEEARQLVEQYLNELAKTASMKLAILDEQTMETDFGWVFFWNSKQYKETGDFHFAVAGNAPIIVDRRDSSIHSTSTSSPIEEIVDAYRRSHPNTSPRV